MSVNVTWDVMYEGALYFQDLVTLSRKIRVPRAEVFLIINYLANASFSQVVRDLCSQAA